MGEHEISKLMIGTAQFGLDYGITNHKGRVPLDDARRIAETAYRLGVRWLDTASAYGDAEAMIARLEPFDHCFRISTKVGSKPVSSRFVNDLQEEFERSLGRLGRTSVDTLLLHNSEILWTKHREAAIRWLIDQRVSGKATRIGVSVYGRDEISALLSQRWELDSVQLPISVFDQRLARDGTLAELACADIEVQARSVFLQGLVFAEPDCLPPHFASLREPLMALRREAENAAVESLNVALSYVLQLTGVDYLVVGVENVDQLKQIVEVARNPRQFDYSDMHSGTLEVMDPRQWPKSIKING